MSNYLADRRKELGLTMKQVAEAVGVSEATVSRWESGQIANMRRDRIGTYAKVLQVRPTFIMTGEPESPETQKTPAPNKKDERDIAKTLEQLRENSELPNTSEKKQRPIRSLARLEENDLTEAEDEQVSDFISFLLSKRDKKKDI